MKLKGMLREEQEGERKGNNGGEWTRKKISKTRK